MKKTIMFLDGPQQINAPYDAVQSILYEEIANGTVFRVTDSAFLDGLFFIKAITNNPRALESQIANGTFILDLRPGGVEEILSKPFKFSSIGVTVGPCTPEQFCAEHPAYGKLIQLLRKYGTFFDWKATGITVPKLTDEQASTLGIEPTSNRTVVFNAADALATNEAIAIKQSFNDSYLSALAGQHKCTFMMTEDLEIVPTGYKF